MAKIAVIYDRDELTAKIPYAIIVEGWDKKKFGRVKRAYEKEFTEHERRVIAGYYPMFYKWLLVKGVPKQWVFTPENLLLLEEAGNFFGGL